MDVGIRNVMVLQLHDHTRAKKENAWTSETGAGSFKNKGLRSVANVVLKQADVILFGWI